MAAKNRIQLQIDTKFVSNAKDLSKQLETNFSQLDIGKVLSNKVGQLGKQLRSQFTDLGKQLNTPGRNKNQYLRIFEDSNKEINATLSAVQQLKHEFQTMFDSKVNRDNLKQLDALKSKLEELRTLSSQQKGTETRMQTSIGKLEKATGSTYAGSNITQFKDIYKRYQDKGSKAQYTDKQKELLGIYDKQGKLLKGQEKTFKDIMTYIGQILKHSAALEDISEKVRTATGYTTNPDQGMKSVNKDIETQTGLTITPENLENANKALSGTEEVVSRIRSEMRGVNINIEDADAKAQEMKTTMSALKEIAHAFGIALGAGQIARMLKRLVKSSYEFYQSLDSALNQIYVVSNLSSKAVSGLTADFINMAEKTGMAIDDVTEAAVLFYQQGLQSHEVMTMTEVTAQFAKVAGTDASDAADKLTAAVNGYCMAAEDAASIADKFNQVAAASAADIDELSTAFSKAAAQANQAGVGMDNYLAYIATMVEATREAPENIGTSLKTIFSRMQQVKEAGTTEDGDTDVNKVETALKSVGIALRDAHGELRNLEDVFAELGPKWQSLDRNTQAYIGTIVAGTRQQSRFITLMQNWDRVLELAEESENSAGMQALMHAKAMDSVESATQRARVAWQEFISNLASSEVIKGLINLFTGLMKSLNSGSAPLTILLTGLTALMLRLTSMKTTLGDLGSKFMNIWNSMKDGTAYIGSNVKSLNLLHKTSKKSLQMNQKVYRSIKDLNKERDIVSAKLDTEKENYSNLSQQQAENTATLEQLRNQTTETAEQEEARLASIEQCVTKQGQLDQAMKSSQTRINGYNKTLESNADQLKKQEAAQQAAANTILVAVSATTTIIGLLGGLEKPWGKVVTAVVAGLGAITMGVIAADKAIGSTKIGMILSAITLGITAVQSIVSLLNQDTEKVKKESLSEAVDSLSESMDKLKSLTAGINATDRLIAEYNKLSKIIGRTTEQQDRMNTIVQELGDTYGLETFTDAYGNLAINIQDVNDALVEQEQELETLKQDMKDLETEGLMTAMDGGNSLTTYIEKMYSTYAATYKSMIKGLSDEMVGDFLNESSLNMLNSYYKNYLMAQAKANKVVNITAWIEEKNKELDDALASITASGSSGYQVLAKMMGKLQSNIEDMTYDEVLQEEQNFFEKFGKDLGLSLEQWNVLCDSINTTVFKNDSLVRFMQELRTMLSQLNGTYWTDAETGLINNARENLEDTLLENMFIDRSWFSEVLYRAFRPNDHLNIPAFNMFDKPFSILPQDLDDEMKRIDKYIEKGYDAEKIVRKLGPALFEWFEASPEGDKNLNNIKQAIQQYIEAKEDYYTAVEDFKAQHGLLDLSHDEVETLYDSLASLYEQMTKLNIETATFLSNSQELLSFNDVSPEDYKSIIDALDLIDNGLQRFGSDAERYAYLKRNFLDKVLEINPDLTEEGKKKIEDYLNDLFSGLEITADITWSDFADSIIEAGEHLGKLDEVMQDLNDDGLMTLESFEKLADVLSEFMSNLDGLAKVGGLELLGSALDKLALAYDENGEGMYANKEAIQDLIDAEELLVKAKLMELRQTVLTNLGTAQARKIALESEIQATTTLIDNIKLKSGAEIDGAELTKMANQSMQSAVTDDAKALQNAYRTMTSDAGMWAVSSTNYIQAVADAFNKFITGQGSWETIKDTINETLKNVKFGGLNALGIEDNENILYNKEEVLANLESYKKTLQAQLKQYDLDIKSYKKMLISIDSLLDADSLSGLWGDSKEDIEKYVGQLEEIYNLLRKIEGQERRLQHLESYKDLTAGQDYADFLKERISLSSDLSDNYEELLRQQKYLEQTEQNAIKNSPVGDVFSFDEYGNIQMDYDKYLQLQDKSIDGQMSEMEMADKLYKEYEELHNQTMDYYEQHLDGIKQELEARQELVDTYIDFEKDLAKATKDIYQDMLDNKLEAIDTEIEALDKLREARERANQAKEDSKDLSEMQTNLKRAMMDTSGASNTKVLDYQDQIRTKLEEMGEDEYTRRLDDITQALEDEKEQLQRMFDEYFEDWEEFHKLVESRILTDKDSVLGVLGTTEEYLHASDAERRELQKQWTTDWSVAMTALEEDGIGGLQDSIDAIQSSIKTETDKILRDRHDVTEVGTLLSRVLLEYKNQQDAKDKSTTSNSYADNWTDNYSDDPNKDNTDLTVHGKDDGDSDTDTSGDGTKKSKKMEPKMNIEFRPEADRRMEVAVYDEDGEKVTSFRNALVGDKNGKAGEIKEIKGQRMVYFPPAGGFIPTKHFVVPGKLGDKTARYYLHGGMIDYTGPAWVDGKKRAPEAVLNAAQTRAFLDMVDNLAFMRQFGGLGFSTPNVYIDSIDFHVDSMSSIEDGKLAFDTFIDEFKRIGKRTGIAIDTLRLK